MKQISTWSVRAVKISSQFVPYLFDLIYGSFCHAEDFLKITVDSINIGFYCF